MNLTPTRPVPQMRDSVASRGGWSLPSLTSRGGHAGRPGNVPMGTWSGGRSVPWSLVGIAVAVVALVALVVWGVSSCAR